jgi:hypothetical protein
MPLADLTPEALAKANFRGPVRFYDGAKGMARQDWECVDEPRFTYAWQREHSEDKGRQFYMVDGREVADLAEAAKLLALPAPADSPEELHKAEIDAFKFSPRIAGRATRALSESHCNGDAGPFGTVRAWLQRAASDWHGGINRYADKQVKAGKEWPRWLYNAKDAAQESYRAMYLLAADREKDTDLTCALGTRLRDCPILQEIEAAMREERGNPDRVVDDADIDAVKYWTCMGHVLTTDHQQIYDGMVLSTKDDRERTY